LEWGFNPNADTPSLVDVYYLKAANGALLPEVTLHFTRNGNQLTFSWDAEGYALQENSILTNAAGWTNTPGGNVSGVSVTMGAANKYFRLKQQ
jgi:YD repeat-containing protein